MEHEPRGCQREGMTSFVCLEVKIPHPVKETDDELLCFLLLPNSTTDRTNIFNVVLKPNPETYKEVQTRVREVFDNRLDLDDTKITITLRDDERRDIGFDVMGAYVDAHPVHGPTRFVTASRGTADIVRSDVAISYLESIGAIAPFVLLFDHVSDGG